MTHWLPVHIEPVLASSHLVRDHIWLLVTISQPFPNCEQDADYDVAAPRVNDLEAYLGPAGQGDAVEGSDLIVYANFIPKSDESILDMEVVDVLSNCEWLKHEIVESLRGEKGLSLLFGLVVFGELITVSAIISVALMVFYSLRAVVMEILIFGERNAGVIFILMHEVFLLFISIILLWLFIRVP
jgi:hypothetical protein